MAHTPGPWTYDVSKDSQRAALARKFGIDEDGFTECELRTVAETQHTPKLKGATYLGVIYEETNARLIAAAPELLEALQAMHTEYRALYPQDATTRLIEKAWRAIAKATGQLEKVSA